MIRPAAPRVKAGGGYNPRDGEGRAGRHAPVRAGGALGAAARPAAPLDGPGGGGREGGRAVRARDVAPQLRAVLPPRRPAALRPRDARPRAAQLVGGAPARRQRAHARGAAVELDPDRGARGPHALRPLRRVEPGRRGGPRPLHREARPPHDPRDGAHPGAGVVRGPAPAPPRHGEAVAAAVLDLPGGGQDPLPRGEAQRPRGDAHRQEVQAGPRPHPQPAGEPDHPRDPRPRGAAAGGEGVPRAVPAAALPGVRRPRAAARGAAARHHPAVLARRLRDAPAPRLRREEGPQGPRHRAPAVPGLRLVRVLPPARAQEGREHGAHGHLRHPAVRERAGRGSRTATASSRTASSSPSSSSPRRSTPRSTGGGSSPTSWPAATSR